MIGVESIHPLQNEAGILWFENIPECNTKSGLAGGVKVDFPDNDNLVAVETSYLVALRWHAVWPNSY